MNEPNEETTEQTTKPAAPTQQLCVITLDEINAIANALADAPLRMGLPVVRILDEVAKRVVPKDAPQ